MEGLRDGFQLVLVGDRVDRSTVSSAEPSQNVLTSFSRSSPDCSMASASCRAVSLAIIQLLSVQTVPRRAASAWTARTEAKDSGGFGEHSEAGHASASRKLGRQTVPMARRARGPVRRCRPSRDHGPRGRTTRQGQVSRRSRPRPSPRAHMQAKGEEVLAPMASGPTGAEVAVALMAHEQAAGTRLELIKDVAVVGGQLCRIRRQTTRQRTSRR